MGSQIGALVSGLWGDAGANFVGLQGGPEKVFGTKPGVAPYESIDLGEEIGKSVGFNLENLTGIKGLLDQYIPGFSDILGQASQITQSQLRGELPPDVLSEIQRSSAYQSLAGGYSGTPMAAAGEARNLGLSSLALQQQGLNNFQQWQKVATEAFSPFVVSAGQTAGTTAANLAGEREALQMQYNINAAPDPGALGVFNLDAALGQQMLSFGMGAAGGALGGGGGGGYQAPGSTAAGGSYYQAPVPGYNLPPNYNAGYGSTDWRTNATWGGAT